tara:strand:+ start:100934 stop:102070 length:1137 start_codon:yes stop_codon:yes gene_type:complete
MRLRTFLADSMTDAIEQVRNALGDDAIIVASHENGSGRIEVTAAVETIPATHIGRDFMPDADDPLDVESRLEQMLRQRLHGAATIDANADAPFVAFNKSMIAAALERHAVPATLRGDLIAAAVAFDNGDAIAALAGALETRFGFEPLPIRPHTPVMAVGLPGAGKTVTLAKLAARAIVDGAPADIFTADTSRTGAVAQGEAYAQLVGIQLRCAGSVDALAMLLDEGNPSPGVPFDRSERPCFIDTASINPFDRADLTALRKMIECTRSSAGVEPVLVLSALGDSDMVSEVAIEFARLGARRIVATQMDIARRLGPILSAADASGMAIAQISVTPYLARGLAQMNASICAHMILSESIPADTTAAAAAATAKPRTGQST